jgi:soluble lytic murein transglycosylase-like protein
MNLLSNSKTSIIDRKCLCGTNCDDYASWIVDASTTYTIPDELILLAIMIQESSCSLTAESSGGDMGLMQINPDNCVGQYGLSSNKDTCKSLLLTNGETNINVGAQILKGAYISSSKTYDCGGVVKTYTGWEAALRGYNGWGNKTTGSCGVVTYVGDVEKKYARLVSLYG